MASTVGHVAAGVALVAGFAATAYTIAAALGARHRLSHRLCASAIIAVWWATLLFYALAAFAAFTLPLALALTFAAAVAACGTVGRRPDARECYAADWAACSGLLRRPPDPLILISTVAVAAVLLVRLFKGLLAPPLGWDGLTYHLVRAARWVQHGGWAPDPAPDAWRYYEYFPPGGDVLWAWSMLPDHSDGFVAIAGALLWVAAVLGAYGAAVALGARRVAAWTTALALCVMPSLMAFVTSSYVTGPMLAALLLGLTHALLVLHGGGLFDAALALAAFGIAAGIQALGLPFLVLATLGVVAARWWHRGLASIAPTAAVALVVAAPMLTGYVVAWIDTGSPLYPLPLTVAGRTLLAGNEQLAGVFSGSHYPQLPPFSLSGFVSGLVTGVAAETRDHLNFGPGAVPLVVLGAMGVPALLRGPGGRAAALSLSALVVIPVVGIASADMLAQRTLFAPIAGRLVAPSLAAVALAGTLVGSRTADWARAASVGLGVWYALPASVSGIERAAMAEAAPYAVAAAVVAAITVMRAVRGERRFLPAAVGVAVAAVLLTYGTSTVRPRYRHQIYAATVQPADAPYDVHPMLPFLSAWTLWRTLDGDQPARVAVAAGWDGFNGHTVLRYPLFGSRLQNAVVYVPPTRNGEIIDHQRLERLTPHLDQMAWLGRLIRGRIDYVVIAVPGAPELEWVRQNPQAFIPTDVLPGLWTSAFRVDHAELRALFSRSR